MELKNARIFCWLASAFILAVFIHLKLLKFLVFLLFMHLATDLLMHGLSKRIPVFSKKAILYTTHILLIAVVISITLFVLPHFFQGLPVYLENQLNGLRPKLAEVGIQLDPNLDFQSIKTKVMSWFQEHMSGTLDYLKRAGTNIFLFLFALIINFLLAHQTVSQKTGNKPDTASYPSQDTLFTYFSAFLIQKIGSFYSYFKQVMGAQVIISLINTGLTLLMLVVLGIPHKIILAVLCFVFGLIPVVGNLISNTLICLAAFLWAGIWQTAAALAFLTIIHKLEYFLNGKIIGHMVKLPVHMALMAILIGEFLFHISGMILAIPMLLFIREELKTIQIRI